MLKHEKRQLFEICSDDTVQVFLNSLLASGIRELKPVFDAKLGYRFPIVEELIGDSKKASIFLKKLASAGVLEKYLFDKIISCPECGSADVPVRYCCPFCKSSDIERSSLVEHIKCGYMDIESNFLLDNELTCPKCHVALKNIDVDFRKAGIWCTCKTCRKSFDIPVPEHFCRTCNAKSTFEDVVIKDVYAYSLKANGITESSLNCLFADAIRKFLIEQDLLVKSPATFQGKSGAQHSFDIVGFKGKGSEKPIVFDLAISTSGVVSEQPVISLFAKIFDISTEKAYLIAVPKLSENGRKMAELYKISAIEARSQEEAIDSLSKDLGTV